MDVVTLALAVDSTQVTSASTALDKFATAGTKAEGAAASLARAATDQSRAIGNSLAPAADKGAQSMKGMGDAQKAIGTGAVSAFTGVASGLAGVEAAATAAAAAVGKVGLSYQQFRRERLAPLRDQFVADGMPLADAQAKAVKQVSEEWKRYRQEWTAAQSTVLAQSGAVTNALVEMAAQAARAEQAVRSAIAGKGGDASHVNALAAAANEAEKAKTAVSALATASTSLGAAPFERVNSALKETALSALRAAHTVDDLRMAEQRAGSLAGATTSLGAGGATSGSTSDVAQLNAVASAASRAERQVDELGNALRRSVGQGANDARSAVRDLSSIITNLGATGFVNFDKVTTSLGATSTKAQEAAREVNALRREIELTGPLKTASTSLGASVGPEVPAGTLREAILRQPQPILDPRLAGTATAAGAAAAGASKQIAELGKAGQLSSFQLQQLHFQLHDFFVQVVSGQSPLTAFIQQGSQLAGTFDGAGNALRAVTSLITPMRLAIGGAAGAVIGLAIAFNEGEKRSKAFQDAALLSGNFAGKTEGQFNQLARAVSSSTDASVLKVRELGQALLATGEIGPQAFNKALQAGVGFGEATKQTADQVAKDFARVAREPSKAFSEMNRQLNFPNASKLYDLIKGLEDAGKTGEASAVVFDALNQRFPKLQQNITTVDDALSKAQRSFVRFWESAFAPTTVEDRIKSLTDRVNQLRAAASGSGPGGVTENGGGAAFVRPRGIGSANTLASSETELADLQRRQFRQSENAAADALQAETQKEAVAAKSSIEQWAKRGKAASLYKEEVEKLKKGFEANELADTPIPKDVQAAALEGVRKAFTNSGRGTHEAQQVLDAQLEQKVKAARDALTEERENMAFSQRVLQESYRQGSISLRDFYEEKRQTIARGVAAEVAELEKERADVQAHLEATRKTSPDDKSALVKDETRLKEITAQQEKARRQGSHDTALANLEETASFKQLNDQIQSYRANLLQLQGDEVGALRIRNQVTLEQARLLDRAAQAQAPKTTGTFARLDRGQAAPLGELEQAQSRANSVQEAITDAKNRTSAINQRLQIEEERIATAQSTGAITTLDSLKQVSERRSEAVALLEKEVAKLEELAAANRELHKEGKEPLNVQLQIDTARAQSELDRLRSQVDPLRLQFNNLFKDAGTDFFTSLMSGDFKGAFRNFGAAISRELNGVVARELSESLFGKDGTFKNAGGFLAQIFGKGTGSATNTAQESFRKSEIAAQNASVDTSAVTASFTNLQTAGIDPTVSALARLQQAADAAAGSVSGRPGNLVTTEPTTGDFTRLDRQTPSGEQSVLDQFKDADRTASDLAKTNAFASTAVTQLANAASKGGGALSLLPAIISAIQTASVGSSGSGGGGIVGSILGAISGGGSAATFTTGQQASYYIPDAGYFARGGWTGDADVDKATGIVHGKEIVFSAAAVKTIGKDALLEAHDEAKKGKKPSLFSDVGKFHTGGLVGQAAAKVEGLKTNEVPAVLMGGPKGVREEVLTASDPRHRDNLKPETAAVIFAQAPRYHTGGLVGLEPDRRSEILTRDRRYLTREESRSDRKEGAQAGDTHIHMTVTPPVGASRETAKQWGSTAAKHLRNSVRSNG